MLIDKVNIIDPMIEKYQMIFDDSPLGICITEIDGSIKMNNTFRDMLGYTKDEALTASWKDIIFNDDINEYNNFFDFYSDEADSIKKIEKRFVKRDGTVIWTEVTSKLKTNDDATAIFIITTIQDISENKRLLEKLNENEIRYKEMFENNPNPMWVYDIRTLKFLAVNEAAISLYGFNLLEFKSMTLKDIKIPEDIPVLMNQIGAETSTIQESATYRHRKKDGSNILVKLSSHNIEFHEMNARVMTVIDVTEKVAAKQSLITEVAKLNSIIESTSDAIFSVDENYCYTSFNKSHSSLMNKVGKATIELGTNFLDYMVTEQEKLAAKTNIDKALQGERIDELLIIGDDVRTQIHLNTFHNPIKNENGDVIGVSVFTKDVTETIQINEQLKKQEKDFHTLFTEDLTGDFIATPAGKIILCNPKFLQIFGFKSESEAYETSVELLYKNPLDRSIMLEKIRNVRKIENIELEMVHRDGRTIYVLENIVGQYDGDGKLITTICYILDITEQKKAFDKIKQLSKAVEQSPVTIIVTDTDGNIQYINQKGVEVTGFSLEEILGKNSRILSSGKMKKEDYKVLWENIKSGIEWRGEFHNKKKNGDLYWESASICPLKNEKGEITNFLAVKEDITDRKKIENELIVAKEKAEEINKIKSSFLSNMSHELRTPLAGILGFADILSEMLTDETEKTMAVSILQAGKRLLNTLTSLLSLSELETAKPNIELKEIDANAVCNDIINFYKVNSKNPNVEFRTEFESEKMYLKINYRLLKDALENLLQNSVTYTESGSIVIKTLTKMTAGSSKPLSIIEVIDTGIGIPRDKLKIIFEEFRQVSEGLTRNFDGLGLGLTLTKKYLELINATIDIESEVDKGTKLIITFQNNFENRSESADKKQIDKTGTSQRTPLIKNNSRIKDKRILLVEDDHINRLFIEKCLSNLCEFVSVNTGEQAVKVSTENKFDLILMDINLGKGMDGTTAAKMIRKIYGHENTQMIAMTAFASDRDKKKFLLDGFSYYISKPFFKHQIIRLVNEILSER